MNLFHRLVSHLLDLLYRLFTRKCRHEYHVRWNGRRWTDPRCVKCGQVYIGKTLKQGLTTFTDLTVTTSLSLQDMAKCFTKVRKAMG